MKNKKFRVEVKSTASYVYIVTAETEEEARREALSDYSNDATFSVSTCVDTIKDAKAEIVESIELSN